MSLPILARRGLAILCFIAACGLLAHLLIDVHHLERAQSERALLHDVRYGLLDPRQWRERIADNLARHIDALSISTTNRDQLSAVVSQALDDMLVDVEDSLRQQARPAHGSSWFGPLQSALQEGVQQLLGDVRQLRAQVPEYVARAVGQIDTTQLRDSLKQQLRDALEKGVDQAVAPVDRSALQAVLAQHGCQDVAACSRLLDSRISALQPAIDRQLVLLLSLAVVLFPLATIPAIRRRGGPVSGLGAFELAVLAALLLLLLIGGLSAPMIAVEASVRELHFELFGEPLRFTDQVLYFQSKSILQVVQVLLARGSPGLWLVAGLLSLFSIVFPLLKLVATGVYAADWRGMRRFALVRFFALYSGKWSMADVLVIAIFMAYLGFDGVVHSQLEGLARNSQQMTVVTSNGTALEAGFWLFLGFVLASLVLAAVLEKRPPAGGHA